MGRITDALRKLGTKLTGKPTVESNNIATVLNDIANDYENTNLTVRKTDTDLYNTLNNALTLGKPILWYEDENTCYYIDTISKSGTDIVLTKGGKTITIEANGDITEVGEIQIKTINLGNLTADADDVSEITNFDDFIISKELYDKLLSGLYPIKANLYDGVDFIGYPNWVDDNNDNIVTNDLIDSKYLLWYIDNADNGLMCYLVIGQLKDKRYFLINSNIGKAIVNE